MANQIIQGKGDHDEVVKALRYMGFDASLQRHEGTEAIFTDATDALIERATAWCGFQITDWTEVTDDPMEIDEYLYLSKGITQYW